MTKNISLGFKNNAASAGSQGYPVAEYWLDAWERSILLLDTLRERGNNCIAHNARTAPNVLSFQAELLLDGRTFERPINYVLVRIVPPERTDVDDRKRPFIVFDPRAGHGPGIGGMKHDSEIGEVLAAGHPCYFAGFLPAPVPGQTIEDVCLAEARFIETVADRHPQAQGKPALIGNCQAGWQIAMTSAIRPDLPGPLLLAGAPLSYWAGERGKSPMRYLGGLLGGTWMTTAAGDVGAGLFDGANLVANFEAMHPDNTHWKKLYDVYSKADTEPQRFLEFEKWWGSPVLLNAEEMQYIADNLFVGNKLSTGELRTADGERIDLRNIRSPIIVFCSHGDDITPPPQALGWILDLYDHESEIVANGQTIIYTLHQSIGHLGIFVSGKVATKEHSEFVNCMDLIDLMPPGLYEAVITETGGNGGLNGLVNGRYLLSLEERTLSDIRQLVHNNPEDDRRFAAVAHLSEINQGLYRTYVQPLMRSLMSSQMAELLREVHPNRLRFGMFSDRNPLVKGMAPLADEVRKNRHPADPSNPLLAVEHFASECIQSYLKIWGECRDAATELFFLTTYGSPLVQAMLGLNAENSRFHRHIERDLAREIASHRAQIELEASIHEGGEVEAFVRAVMYLGRPAGRVDERGYRALSEILRMLPPEERPSFAEFKEMVRRQFLILVLDQERAIRALPNLARTDRSRRRVLSGLQRLASSYGAENDEQRHRMQQIEALLGGPDAHLSRGQADREELLLSTSAQ